MSQQGVGGHNGDLSAEVPAEFLCPIQIEIMKDPVSLADGRSYEREAIAKWLQSSNRSPMTGATLLHTHMNPNTNLKALIADWRDSQAVQGVVRDAETVSAKMPRGDLIALRTWCTEQGEAFEIVREIVPAHLGGNGSALWGGFVWTYDGSLGDAGVTIQQIHPEGAGAKAGLQEKHVGWMIVGVNGMTCWSKADRYKTTVAKLQHAIAVGAYSLTIRPIQASDLDIGGTARASSHEGPLRGCSSCVARPRLRSVCAAVGKRLRRGVLRAVNTRGKET